jgi:RNA recognition motif-containing protein
MTRQNAGYAFVVMPDDDQARAAIEGLNGLEIEGRTIVVNKSVPKEDNPIEKERKRNKSSFKADGNRGGDKKPFKKEDGRKSNFKSNKGKGGF